MTGKYLKIFVDYLDKYQKLNDAEFGRLIRAALTYKATGVEVGLMGREELLWDGIKLDIDRGNKAYTDVCKSRSEAGKAGAAKRWQNGKNSICHSSIANDSKTNFSIAKNGKCQEEKEKEKEKDKDISSPSLSPPSLQMPPKGNDDDDFVSVVRLWEKAAGRLVSPLQGEELQALLEEHTTESVSNAIRSAAQHNAVNLAYIKAVLNGKPKQQASGEKEYSPEMQAWLRGESV